MLHYDSAPVHTLLLQNFVTKMGTTVVQQPSYLPDLAPADFFLFSKMKSTLKRQRCGTKEEFKGNWLMVQKVIPKQAFKDCSENWKKHLERDISSGG
jgi:hypothetical protein